MSDIFIMLMAITAEAGHYGRHSATFILFERKVRVNRFAGSDGRLRHLVGLGRNVRPSPASCLPPSSNYFFAPVTGVRNVSSEPFEHGVQLPLNLAWIFCT
jgi:hypothetical protein